ncbi:MAG: hypothetical protein UT17_C0012G0003 [Candidatus Woesebacteria bacterium GW2011_GWB1_39_10]|uniref:SinR family protein n=1 Tax=Candidatus Woesebacteria bacterium GW2011_GWB1_39_10 TaxID=1618572 RepID=A0A0G0LHF0_9BACT|nr:MAG: hypothetical protein UT17_C0012G0003 [Candidatus Woesebacteria bacterium GW2011_GWB1_39_10]
MKTYLISYDLIKPETSPEYTRLINLIKTAKFWAKPLESVWLIKSPLGSMEILNQLRTAMDSNDKILVIEITNNWASLNLPQQVTEWMKQGL